MTDIKDLIARLIKDYENGGSPCCIEAVNALDAAQAEIVRVAALCINSIASHEETVGRAMRAEAEIERLTGECQVAEELEHKHRTERDAALAQLAESKAWIERLTDINRDALSNLNELADTKNAEIEQYRVDCFEAIRERDQALARLAELEKPAQDIPAGYNAIDCPQCGFEGCREAQPAQVPESWQLVPVEPTEAMLKAGNKHTWPYPCVYPYKAMLSAAPVTKEQNET